MPLVCAWLVGLANTERGGADQSRKVLCFVDFKLRQEKTFANKLARYLLTKLRNRQPGWDVRLVIWGYCIFRIDPYLDIKCSHVMCEFFVASNIKRELPPLT